MILLEQRDVPELAAGGLSSLGLGQALADISLGEQTKVRLDLVVEFSIRSLIPEQSSNFRRQRARIMDHLYLLPFCHRIVLSVIRGGWTVMDQSLSRAAPGCSSQSGRRRPAAKRCTRRSPDRSG